MSWECKRKKTKNCTYSKNINSLFTTKIIFNYFTTKYELGMQENFLRLQRKNVAERKLTDNIVKPVYGGHLQFLKKVSVINRCLLYRGF